jgi:hypothetical protein
VSELNRDHEERDRLLFGRAINWGHEGLGGIERFSGLGVETLRTLVARNFADPADRQNDSPTLGEFLRFLEKHPEVRAHGYAVSPEREDYRVTIEGLEYAGPVSAELRREFRQMNGAADECVCEAGRLYCWYD